MADFEAVDAELFGQLIHSAFGGETGLRTTAAAIRRDLHGRRIDRVELDPDIGNAIRAGDRGRSHLRDRDAVGNEGAGIVQKAVTQPDHLAGLERRELDDVNLRALLRRANEVLAAVLDIFDRPSKLHCRHRHQQFVRIEQQHFLAEAATDVRRYDPDFVFVELEYRRQAAADRNRSLRSVPHREFAGDRIPACRHGTALHWRRGRTIDLNPNSRDVLGACKRGVRIARCLDKMGREIVGHVGMNQRRAVLQCLGHVHFDGKRFELHLDQGRSVLGNIAVDRHYHGDGLSDVIDIAARQRPLRLRIFHRRMRNQKWHWRVERADIVAGIDRRDTGMVAGRRDVERLDAGARQRTAQECCVQCTDQRNVVNKSALAAQQLRIDIAFDAGAECACRHKFVRYSRPSSSAARRTAAMMLM